MMLVLVYETVWLRTSTRTVESVKTRGTQEIGKASWFYTSETLEMTFKSLLNLGSAGKSSHPFIDRYHSGSGGSSHHGWQGGSYKSKGSGGSGAALSALTLLAFLFLINVMQQSLQDTNSTMTTMTTVLLREEDAPVILDARNKNEGKRKEEHADTYGPPPAKSTKAHVKLNN